MPFEAVTWDFLYGSMFLCFFFSSKVLKNWWENTAVKVKPAKWAVFDTTQKANKPGGKNLPNPNIYYLSLWWLQFNLIAFAIYLATF